MEFDLFAFLQSCKLTLVVRHCEYIDSKNNNKIFTYMISSSMLLSNGFAVEIPSTISIALFKFLLYCYRCLRDTNLKKNLFAIEFIEGAVEFASSVLCSSLNSLYLHAHYNYIGCNKPVTNHKVVAGYMGSHSSWFVFC